MTGAGPRPRVILDLQAAQSATYRERGVARYAVDFAKAVAEHPAGVLDQVLIREDLLPIGRIEGLIAAGVIANHADWRARPGAIFHALSPLDLEVPLRHVWPRPVYARRWPFVVTVYDLIPDQFPDMYLEDPGTRRRYQVRLEVVRAADHVMTLSRAVADAVHERLAVPHHRISVVGAASAPRFSPPPDRAAARAAAGALVPGLRPRTVVYNGAIEPRKNMERLLTAFARMPEAARSDTQLVLVCRLDALQRNHLEHMARVLGVADQVLLTGEISDEALVALYRAAELVAFPSYAEGYGLPVAEAMACGAPVVASGNSALAELVAPEATFDPYSEDAIASAMARPLTDPAFRGRLVEWSARPRPTWADVADRAVEVYERVSAVPRPGRSDGPCHRNRRPTVAVVTPWPPAASGVAVYSALLVAEMARHVDVEIFVEDEDDEAVRPEADGRFVLHPAWSFRAVEAARSGYDAVFVCIGNSHFHCTGLSLIREGRLRPVTLAHDVRLTELYCHAAARGGIPEGLAGVVTSMYGTIPPGLIVDGWIRQDVADNHGVLMSREVVAHSRRVIVTSEFAARLARSDARAEDSDRIEVVPLPYPNVTGAAPDRDEQLLGSFGLVNGVKQPLLLVRALSILRGRGLAVHLVFVGPVSERDRAEVLAEASRRGVDREIELTGFLDERRYTALLSRVSLAVQLRSRTNGEESGAVHDCIAGGVPLVVTGLGAARELPDFVEKVSPDVSADELADLLEALLADPSRRRAMADDGISYARAHDAGRAARSILAAARLKTVD